MRLVLCQGAYPKAWQDTPGSSRTGRTAVFPNRNTPQWQIWFAIKMSKTAHDNHLPVVILHAGNDQVGPSVHALMGSNQVIQIDEQHPIYDPFYSYDGDEIADFLIRTGASDYDIKQNAVSYMEGVVRYMKCRNIPPVFEQLRKCSYDSLFDLIDQMNLAGTLTDQQAQSIKSSLMMGQSEQFKIRSMISHLYKQAGYMIPKQGNRITNIEQAVRNNQVMVIDVKSDMNNLLLDLLLLQAKHAGYTGKRLMLVTEGLTTAGNRMLKTFFEANGSQIILLASGNDLYASCTGDEQLFGTLLGNSGNIVILGHPTGPAAIKWADTIGYYDKIEESQTEQSGTSRHSPFTLFPGSNHSTGRNFAMKREYIIKPEVIQRMTDKEAYVYGRSHNRMVHAVFD